MKASAKIVKATDPDGLLGRDIIQPGIYRKACATDPSVRLIVTPWAGDKLYIRADGGVERAVGVLHTRWVPALDEEVTITFCTKE